MTHLLVTNDYPPKVGGIQNYLWELWRRLDPETFAVFTTPYEGAAEFDAGERYRIDRFRRFFLSPTPDVRREAERIIGEIGASFVLLDPAIPVGHLGPSMSVPYGLVLHGAEVTIPARLPAVKRAYAKTLKGASLIVSASNYAFAEAERLVGQELPGVYVPPGVDVQRFSPRTPAERRAIRDRYGISPTAPLIVSVSRLVPRKGMDVLIEATARLQVDYPDLQTLIIGRGRETDRLNKLIDRTRSPVQLLGSVTDEDLPDLVASADVFSMLCRNRWGGLEQEGFGIVFVEAAAAGVPQVAGNSGGAGEAVAHGETGLIVDDPADVDQVVRAISSLLDDPARRARMGTAARSRAVAEFSYDHLAPTLAAALADQEL